MNDIINELPWKKTSRSAQLHTSQLDGRTVVENFDVCKITARVLDVFQK